MTARAVIEEVDAMQKAGCPEEMASADWNERLEALLSGRRRRATPTASRG